MIPYGVAGQGRPIDNENPGAVCLDGHDPATSSCEGPVEYRAPLSGTGRSFPRCDRHWEARLDRQAEIDRRYPQSDMPPADFDPTYAGETW
jgi:hypothetical protein